ncbi:MAG: Cys-tRNA(Pro) deacylase [Planctomycetes bacterium]|nr:Cys-tRNA(Pro) deacylase [Planctomycetota bacterium]
MKKDGPKTMAIRCLIKHGIEFDVHTYAYEARGGTRVSSSALGVDEHCVIKTVIMETDKKAPLIVLMHGDREVSVKQLSRTLKVKSVQPCDPRVADRHSGYQVGGTSPFGTRKSLPVYAEASILDLERIYINGGKRGLLVSLDPGDLHRALDVTPVSAAIDR